MSLKNANAKYTLLYISYYLFFHLTVYEREILISIFLGVVQPDLFLSIRYCVFN